MNKFHLVERAVLFDSALKHIYLIVLGATGVGKAVLITVSFWSPQLLEHMLENFVYNRPDGKWFWLCGP